VRRLQHGPAGVLELLAGAQDGLVADHAVAFDFLALAVAVGDDPVTAPQLRGDGAEVLDPHRVRERPAARSGLLREEAALHGDPDSLRHGGGHAAKLPVPHRSGNRKP